MSSTYFHETQAVQVAGEPNIRGRIVAVAGHDSVHVKWSTGPDAGSITFMDTYDLDPYVANVIHPNEDPLHLTAVRKAYDKGQDVAVLNFLASHKYLDTWPRIAADVLEYVESRITVDASMDLPQEQLSSAELKQVISSAAYSLLRDAFGETDG